MTNVATGEEPNLVASKTGSVLRKLLRLELGNDENTAICCRGCSTDLILNMLGWSGVSIPWLEATSLREMLCTPVSGGGLGVFLQPLGLLVRPCCCWGAAGSCAWTKLRSGLHILLRGFSTLTLNFSLWVLRMYMMCKKPLEVVCCPLLFILLTMKLKLLCPFGNNEWFVCENSICKKKINLGTCHRLISDSYLKLLSS